MAHSSLQVCMDSSDWLQGTMSEDMSTGLDSSSSPSGGDHCMLAAACSSRGGGGPAALMERRLRPQHDQNLKCPRCDSTHTKFCYYNNYSLSQPRYFCKTCRRYWTKGGTLRNIPVGGGCRKNKKSSSKKSSNNDHPQTLGSQQGSITAVVGSSSSGNPTDLHLSTCTFPPVQFPPHLAHLIGAQMSLGGGGGADFMEGSGSLIRPIDFMETKYEALMGATRGHDFLGSGINGGGGDQFGVVLGGIGDHHGYNIGMSSSAAPFGVGVASNDNIHEEGNYSGGIGFMDHRLLLPYDDHGNHDQHNDHHHHQSGFMDVKPNPKLLSLEWQDQGCTSDAHGHGKDTSFGYNNVSGGGNALGSWSGMITGFQPSTTNSFV